MRRLVVACLPIALVAPLLAPSQAQATETCTVRVENPQITVTPGTQSVLRGQIVDCPTGALRYGIIIWPWQTPGGEFAFEFSYEGDASNPYADMEVEVDGSPTMLGTFTPSENQQDSWSGPDDEEHQFAITSETPSVTIKTASRASIKRKASKLAITAQRANNCCWISAGKVTVTRNGKVFKKVKLDSQGKAKLEFSGKGKWGVSLPETSTQRGASGTAKT